MVGRDRLDAAVARGDKGDLAVAGHKQGDQGDREDARQRELEKRGDPDPGHPQLAARVGAKVRKERKRQSAGERSQSHRGEEKSETVRADVEDLVGEKRHERRAVHGEERERRDQDQQHPDDRLGACVGGTLREPLAKRLLDLALDGGRQVAHQEQCSDRGQVAHRVAKETDWDADERDQYAGDRRPDHRGGVEHRGVQGDRIEQVCLADHLDLERLARRDVEGVDGSGADRGHDHHPVLGVSRRGQREEYEWRNHECRLRAKKHGSLAVAVCDLSGEWTQEEHR